MSDVLHTESEGESPKSLLSFFKERAKNPPSIGSRKDAKKSNMVEQEKDPSSRLLGIGIGNDLEGNRRILHSVQKVALKTPHRFLIVGSPNSIKRAQTLYKDLKNNIYFSIAQEPEEFLIRSFFDDTEITLPSGENIGKLDVIVRGGLGSSKFLKILRKKLEDHMNVGSFVSSDSDFNIIAPLTYRLALMETVDHYQFFYSPVGIDEANRYNDKMQILMYAIDFLKKIGLKPRISILSGGRLSDLGRNKSVDQTIEDAENLTRKISKEFPDIEIYHDQILIEQAIKRRSNIILAPDGISGNLIYRTLVHLGGGVAYGAIYLSFWKEMKKIIIDTSRSAPQKEYEGALYLGLGISCMQDLL